MVHTQREREQGVKREIYRGKERHKKKKRARERREGRRERKERRERRRERREQHFFLKEFFLQFLLKGREKNSFRKAQLATLEKGGKTVDKTATKDKPKKKKISKQSNRGTDAHIYRKTKT